MLSAQTLLYAFLGGLLPALLWLWFWLKEDSKSPEPRRLILLAFVAGMIVVPLALPFERYAETLVGEGTFLVLVFWSAIEEILKYVAALVAVLWRKAVDEPIDTVIYMITVALGFAALENTLFLLNPLLNGDILGGILTGNLRFLGATLLHTLSSAAIGVSLSLAFYKRKSIKRLYLFVGVILAILLHALFNSLIMNSSGENILSIFFVVWIGIIVIIFLFEKVKRIKKPKF